MKKKYLMKLVLSTILTFGLTNLWGQDVFDYTGDVQTYTVVDGTSIRIEVYGAEGGRGNGGVGGLGATMIGDFSVSPGDVLEVIVGEAGRQWNNAGGGGGGTGVLFEGAPLIIAGGGGGGSTSSPAASGGQITEAGGNSSGLGGTGGNGGQKGYMSGDCGWSSGGGGLYGDGYGGNGDWDGGALPGTLSGDGSGKSWASGGAGGINGGCHFNDNYGGWGLGGGGAGEYGGGGGGGYSGGGGGHYTDLIDEKGGAGGGSYNVGTDQINTAASHSGHGQIIITVLCTGLTLDATPTGVCAGESVTLYAESDTGGDVSWDMGIENGVAFVPPLGETVYTCVSTGPDDCILTVTVTSTEIPEIIANSSSPAACEGTEITLWGEGGDTYVWDMGVEDNVPFDAMPGEVTFTLIGSLLGCEAPPVEITLVGAPRPDASSTATPSEICLGESYVLTGDGGSETYNWGRGINDGDELTPASPGSYTHIVIGNSDVGCGDTSMVTVIVHGLPEVHGGSDVAVCEGEEVTLTGLGTRTISWDMGITNGVPFAAEAGEIVYTVTGTDINGCEDTDEVLVTGVEIPRIASSDITPEYFGYDGVIDITVEGGSGEYTYAWSHGPTTEDASSLTDGTYTVIINDITLEKGLCPMEATFTIGTELGLDDVEFVELNVYPNPTTDRLVIVTAGTFNYDVLSITGEVILQGQGTDQAELSMEELANGAYIIRVNANDKIGFAQVVKQ